MRRRLAAFAATVLSGAVAAGGCGIGPGDAAEGTATLRVTSEFGAEEIATGTLEDPTPSDTVVRFLDDSADIETSYGGNFVDSIDGLAGSTTKGGPEDWFFFVNGYYSDIGAGEAKVRPGDRIWWDYRDWQEAYRVPAVVGSWPAPLAGREGGEQPAVIVECMTQEATCDDAVDRMRDAGIDPEVETVDSPAEHPDDLRVLIGPWERLRDDPAASQLESGPSTSGVYARLEPCGSDWALSILGSDAEPSVGSSTGGFVAAVREREQEPTWIVAGTDEDSVADAVALLDADALRDRYAVASIDGGEPQSIPAADSPAAEPATDCPR